MWGGGDEHLIVSEEKGLSLKTNRASVSDASMPPCKPIGGGSARTWGWHLQRHNFSTMLERSLHFLSTEGCTLAEYHAESPRKGTYSLQSQPIAARMACACMRPAEAGY